MWFILEFPESASCPVSIYNFVCSVLLTHHPAALKPWVQTEFGAKGNRFVEEQSSFFSKGRRQRLCQKRTENQRETQTESEWAHMTLFVPRMTTACGMSINYNQWQGWGKSGAMRKTSTLHSTPISCQISVESTRISIKPILGTSP